MLTYIVIGLINSLLSNELQPDMTSFNIIVVIKNFNTSSLTRYVVSPQELEVINISLLLLYLLKRSLLICWKGIGLFVGRAWEYQSRSNSHILHTV